MRYASLMGSPMKHALNSHSMFLWSRALKCNSAQLTAPGPCVDGEGLSFLQGAGHWKLGHAPVSMSETQIRHVWSCLLSPFLVFKFLFSFSKEGKDIRRSRHGMIGKCVGLKFMT